MSTRDTRRGEIIQGLFGSIIGGRSVVLSHRAGGKGGKKENGIERGGKNEFCVLRARKNSVSTEKTLFARQDQILRDGKKHFSYCWRLAPGLFLIKEVGC